MTTLLIIIISRNVKIPIAEAYPADWAEKYWFVTRVDREWVLNPGPPLVSAITRSKSF